jgi:hypothetical protein
MRACVGIRRERSDPCVRDDIVERPSDASRNAVAVYVGIASGLCQAAAIGIAARHAAGQGRPLDILWPDWLASQRGSKRSG